MQITKSKLKNIIQEELQKVLQEQKLDPRFTDPATLGTGARLMRDPLLQVVGGGSRNMLPNLPKELRGEDYVPWPKSVPRNMLPNLPWQEDNPDYVQWLESFPHNMLPNLQLPGWAQSLQEFGGPAGADDMSALMAIVHGDPRSGTIYDTERFVDRLDDKLAAGEIDQESYDGARTAALMGDIWRDFDPRDS